MINPKFSVGFGDTATKNAYLHVKMHFLLSASISQILTPFALILVKIH